jgi:hypothetical protein
MADYSKLLNDFKNWTIDPETTPDLALAVLDHFGYAGNDDSLDIHGKQGFEGTKGSKKALVIIAAKEDDAFEGLKEKDLDAVKKKVDGPVTLYTNFGVMVHGNSMRTNYPDIKIVKIPGGLKDVKVDESYSLKNLKKFDQFVNESINEGNVSHDLEAELKKLDPEIKSFKSIQAVTYKGHQKIEHNQEEIAELNALVKDPNVKRVKNDGGSFHDFFVYYKKYEKPLFGIAYTEKTVGYDEVYLVPEK